MWFQSLEHDEVISNAGTGRDLLWLKASVAMIEKNQLPGAGLEDSRGRNNELTSQAGLHIDIHEHARLQLEARIRHRQPYTNRAGCHIHLRQDLFDLAGECAGRIGIDGNLCRIARLQSSNIVLKYLRV